MLQQPPEPGRIPPTADTEAVRLLLSIRDELLGDTPREWQALRSVEDEPLPEWGPGWLAASKEYVDSL